MLEICFFFYYIGPMETDMFLSYIKRLVKEPLLNLDQILIKHNLNKEMFLNEILDISDNEKELEYQSNQGKKNRQKHNSQLFNKTIEYWTFILVLSIFLFIIEYAYIYYKKKKEKKVIPQYDEEHSIGWEEPITSTLQNSFTETNSLVSYRKNSADDADIDYHNVKEKNKACLEKSKKGIIFTIYYSIFGVSIIAFQYIFFEFVVFSYKPLSIEEIKYYVYKIIIN